MSTERLRVAVQKSGRLAEASLGLLRRAGLVLDGRRDDLFLHGENQPIDVLLVRDDDIPALLVEGSADLGIVGRNVLAEQCQADAAPDERIALGFGACRLAIAVPQSREIATVDDLRGLRIATSYPALLGQWLGERSIDAEIVVLTGSVEIAPRLGKADAICDLVSTGATLAANRLRELVTVFESEAVLAAAPGILTPAKAALAGQLAARIAGALSGDGVRLLMLQAPRAMLPAIERMLPSRETPSVLSLDGRPDDVALQALCTVALDWQHLEALKRLGARGLMVLHVERMLA